MASASSTQNTTRSAVPRMPCMQAAAKIRIAVSASPTVPENSGV